MGTPGCQKNQIIRQKMNYRNSKENNLLENNSVLGIIFLFFGIFRSIFRDPRGSPRIPEVPPPLEFPSPMVSFEIPSPGQDPRGSPRIPEDPRGSPSPKIRKIAITVIQLKNNSEPKISRIAITVIRLFIFHLFD